MAASLPEISKLSSRVIRVLGCNPGPMTLQGTNTYIIGTGERRILIDTGEGNMPKYTKNLLKVLKKDSATLENIILTHWHHDHIGGVVEILKYIDKGKSTVWKYKRTDVANQALPNDIAVTLLKNNQELRTEGATLRVVHTPGHTTDHIVLVLDEESAVFSGDCILGEGTAAFEDLHDYMASLEVILKLRPSIIYPGHGPVIENPTEKIQYYIDHRNQREAQILSVLKEAMRPLTDMEIVELIYKETPKHLHPVAAANVNHHLTKLRKQRNVEQTEQGWQLNNASNL